MNKYECIVMSVGLNAQSLLVKPYIGCLKTFYGVSVNPKQPNLDCYQSSRVLYCQLNSLAGIELWLRTLFGELKILARHYAGLLLPFSFQSGYFVWNYLCPSTNSTYRYLRGG